MTVGAEGLNEGTHHSIEDDCREGVYPNLQDLGSR